MLFFILIRSGRLHFRPKCPLEWSVPVIRVNTVNIELSCTINSKLHLQLASSTSKYSFQAFQSVHMCKATWLSRPSRPPHRGPPQSCILFSSYHHHHHMSLFQLSPVHRAALQLQVACHPVLLIHKQNLVSSCMI